MDNADDPGVLVQSAALVRDGNGIVRGSHRGTLLLTSRVTASIPWGGTVALHPVPSLRAAVGARVLRDLAGRGAGTLAEATVLAARLGGLPLALRTAGTYLASTTATLDGITTYASYGSAVDDRFAHLLGGTDGDDGPRDTVIATWELSLDLLGQQGLVHTRKIMRLIGAFASAPIPIAVLDPEILGADPWFRAIAEKPTSAGRAMRALDGLRRVRRPAYDERAHRQAMSSLRDLALIDISTAADAPCLVAHPLVVEANAAAIHRDGMTQQVLRLVLTLLTTAGWDPYTEDLTGARRQSMLAPHLRRLLTDHNADLPPAALAQVVAAANATVKALYLSGDYVACQELAGAACRVADGHLSADDPVRLGAWHHQTVALLALDHYGEAEPWIRRTLEARQRTLGPAHRDTLCTHHNLAYALAGLGQYHEADVEYADVIRKREATHGPTHHRTLRARINRVHAIASSGRVDQAISQYIGLLDLAERSLGTDHIDTQDCRRGLASVLFRSGRFADSARAYRQVALSLGQSLGTDHPETLISRHALAGTLAGLGRLREATREYADVLKARERVLGRDHHLTRLTRQELDRCHETPAPPGGGEQVRTLG